MTDQEHTPAGAPESRGQAESLSGVEMRFRGPRGPQGEPGEQGSTGPVMPGVIAWLLLALVLVMGASNLLASYLIEQNGQGQQRQAEQAAQKAGNEIEVKLCTDVGTMSRLAPPAGNPASNPSRAYEQAEHRTWRGLYDSLECGKLK